jgi:hypothetical protein
MATVRDAGPALVPVMPGIVQSVAPGLRAPQRLGKVPPSTRWALPRHWKTGILIMTLSLGLRTLAVLVLAAACCAAILASANAGPAAEALTATWMLHHG